MLNTFDEIKKNNIVNRFDKVVENFGLYGTYVNWQPGGLNEGGIYFICGLDKDKILGHNIDMFQIIDDQKRNKTFLCTDVTFFKINGQHPFMVHRSIIDYCQLMDSLQKVYAHINKPIPKHISRGTAETMKMIWSNITKEGKTDKQIKEYTKILTFAASNALDYIPNGKKTSNKAQFVANGYYDSDRGKLYNWFKRVFFRHKNEVSLTHLVAQAGKINYAKILYSDYAKCRKELDERPDILYSFSRVRGHILDVSEGEGYGSKEDNDNRFYTLYFPSYCTKDVEKIIQKIDFPAEFNRTPDEIDPCGYGTEHLIIPIGYFDAFKSFCDENHILCGIDKSAYDTVANGMPIYFSSANANKAYGFLSQIIKASENDKAKNILPKPSYHPTIENTGSIDEKIKELKSLGFERVDVKNMKTIDLSEDR